MKRHNLIADSLGKGWWQRSIEPLAGRDWLNAGIVPIDEVDLAGDDPGAFAIQPQVPLYTWRNFDSLSRWFRFGVCNRTGHHARCPAN